MSPVIFSVAIGVAAFVCEGFVALSEVPDDEDAIMDVPELLDDDVSFGITSK